MQKLIGIKLLLESKVVVINAFSVRDKQEYLYLCACRKLISLAISFFLCNVSIFGGELTIIVFSFTLQKSIGYTHIHRHVYRYTRFMFC